MAIVTVIVGILLTFLGFSGCFSPEPSSISAGAPFWIGLALLLLGLVALKPKVRKHAMHLAALVALVGLLLGGRGLFLRTFTRGVSTHAGYNVLLMMLVCGIFLVLCINSFMRARRKRAKERAAAA